MATTLLTVSEVKDHLGIIDIPLDEPNAAVENEKMNNKIESLIEEAEGRLQAHIGNYLLAVPRTKVWYGGHRKWAILGAHPIDPAAEFSLEDITDAAEAVPLDAIEYELDLDFGRLRYAYEHGWPKHRKFRATFTGGLELNPDWETILMPELRGSLKDYITWVYEHNDPGLKSIAEGAGLSRTYTEQFLPPRVAAVWNSYRPLLF